MRQTLCRGRGACGAGAATDGRVGAAAALRRRRASAGGEEARSPPHVVDPHHEGPQRRVRDDADRAGSTTMRWNWSRCMPSASASTALMTSPCETTTYTASSPRRGVPLADRASTARACMSRIASPPSPGNVIADGWACTTFHSGSLASFFSSPPGPVAVAHLADALVDVPRDTASRPASSRSAVSWQRCSGLVTTAGSGTGPAGRPGRDLRPADVVEATRLRSSRRARRRRWPWSGRGGRAARWSRRRHSTSGVTMSRVIVDCALYRDG